MVFEVCNILQKINSISSVNQVISYICTSFLFKEFISVVPVMGKSLPTHTF